jgi:hypothetical protein
MHVKASLIALHHASFNTQVVCLGIDRHKKLEKVINLMATVTATSVKGRAPLSDRAVGPFCSKMKYERRSDD